MNIIKRNFIAVLFLIFLNKIAAQINSPEYTSFEPVNSDNMVQLNTGDFIYNLPLVNVPGINGGYPINLFYHGGITMEQEASWTGLGWNINVGAIERNVKGYPDDYNGKDIHLAMKKDEVVRFQSRCMEIKRGNIKIAKGLSFGFLFPSSGTNTSLIDIKKSSFD